MQVAVVWCSTMRDGAASDQKIECRRGMQFVCLCAIYSRGHGMHTRNALPVSIVLQPPTEAEYQFGLWVIINNGDHDRWRQCNVM